MSGSSEPPRGASAPLDREIAEAIVRAASLLVVVLDREGRILHFNAACEAATGFPAADRVGRPIWELIPEDQRGEVDGVIAALRETGRASLFENEWLTRGGGRRRIAWSNTVVRDAAGGVARMIGTGIDITGLEAAEERRRDSESRLAGIVHSAMDAIVTIDESQRIRLFNPAAEQMFGRAASEVVGEPLDALVPGRFRDAHRGHVARFARSSQTSRRMGRLGQVWGLRASGEEFPVEAAISQVESGDATLLTVILRDLTERRRLERQLVRTEELAAVATLVTGIAHDIGTPMNVILGYTEMLAGSLREEKDRERLRIIQEQVERVSRLIQTLMNFARPEHETPRELRVEEVLERALSLIAETARKRGVEIERAFETTGTLMAQAERLERAFLDLLVNACDAMRESGGRLRVATREREERVEIEIEDTGVGIAPETLPRIFEPFYTTKPRGQGTGLGLLVTRRIVADHGGTIDVESAPGRGATFRIRLPRSGETDAGAA